MRRHPAVRLHLRPLNLYRLSKGRRAHVDVCVSAPHSRLLDKNRGGQPPYPSPDDLEDGNDACIHSHSRPRWHGT